MDIKIKLGKRIKEIRNKKGITQEFISERINISVSNYSRIENGTSYPKPENIEKICAVLNVTPKDLFDFEHEKPIEKIENEIISAIKKNSKLAREVYRFI